MTCQNILYIKGYYYVFPLGLVANSGRYATKKNSYFDVTFRLISPYTDVQN